MPKILILHALLGSGHLSAANALRDAFGHHAGVEVFVEDTLDFLSPALRAIWQEGYKRLSERAPRLYQLFYEASDSSDLDESVEGNMRTGRLSRPFLAGLEEYVRQLKPDAIICTMQLPLIQVSYLTREGLLDVPFYVVVTDFVAHGTWLTTGAHSYFLPSNLTADLMESQGLDKALMHVTGIPVNPEIATHKPNEATRERHQLPLDRPVITLFGGGIETRRVRRVAEQLLQRDLPGVLAVVAGRNEELTAAIADLGDGPHMELRKLGTIDYVDDLIAVSDLVITKSGGLIVSEVLARGTPMIIIDPIPGQEEWNADFVAGCGAGIQLRMPEMVPPAVLDLLSHQERLVQMQRQARMAGRPRAALDIAERVLADIAGSAQV